MILPIANLKGGVGKTTTAFYMKSVLPGTKLLIDATSETNLTRLFIGNEKPSGNLISVLTGTARFQDALRDIGDNSLFLPGSEEIGLLEKNLAGNKKPEMVLKKILLKHISHYDYVLIDCPPHMSIILGASMVIADHIIIPVAPETQAIVDAHGIVANVRSIGKSKLYGREIDVKSVYILPTMRKWLNRRSRSHYGTIKREFRDHVILPPIPYDRKAEESTDTGVLQKGPAFSAYQKAAEVIIND